MADLQRIYTYIYRNTDAYGNYEEKAPTCGYVGKPLPHSHGA